MADGCDGLNACEEHVSHAKTLLSSRKSGGGFCDASYIILKTYLERSLCEEIYPFKAC